MLLSCLLREDVKGIGTDAASVGLRLRWSCLCWVIVILLHKTLGQIVECFALDTVECLSGKSVHSERSMGCMSLVRNTSRTDFLVESSTGQLQRCTYVDIVALKGV